MSEFCLGGGLGGGGGGGRESSRAISLVVNEGFVLVRCFFSNSSICINACSNFVTA